MEQCFEASSQRAFLEQVVRLAAAGYRWYVTGAVPKRVEEPREVDAKLVAKYDADLPKWTRTRQRTRGLANVRYLRFGRRWVLMVTDGRHTVRESEASNLRDLRETPLRFAGYTISIKPGGFRRKQTKRRVVDGQTGRSRPVEPAIRDQKLRVHVRIEAVHYRRLRDFYDRIAVKRSRSQLAALFHRVPFEPYAPVREQVKRLLIRVNRTRRRAGLEPVPYDALRYRRRRPCVVFQGASLEATSKAREAA